MPIRSSISDPDGASVKEFARMRREGPLPKSPVRKPSAAEREPLLKALAAIPVYENMPKRQWIDKWSMPYMSIKFTLWGVEFAVYPNSRSEHNDTKTCIGVFIKAITRNRRGVQPSMMLNGKFDKTWFRQILDWIEDNYYGG